MLSHIETLIALKNHTTMSEAAVALRVSQSTVSKRIVALEDKLGFELIHPSGRNVALSLQAQQFLTEVEPVIADLNALINGYVSKDQKSLIKFGVSEAILQSWGAHLMMNLHQNHHSIVFEIHAHRSAMVYEKVISGQYNLGICAGRLRAVEDLILEPLWKEPMVLISKHSDCLEIELKRSINEPIDIVTLEKASNTWNELSQLCKKHRLNSVMQVESSFAAAQLALAGMIHALVPLSVAITLGATDRYFMLDQTEFCRSTTLVARKSQFNRDEVQDLVATIKEQMPSLINQFVKSDIWSPIRNE